MLDPLAKSAFERGLESPNLSIVDKIRNLKLTEDEYSYAHSWLLAHNVMLRMIQDPEFTETRLLWMIKVEVYTQQRPFVLKRLWGRYCKLKNKRQWSELMGYIGGK